MNSLLRIAAIVALSAVVPPQLKAQVPQVESDKIYDMLKEPFRDSDSGDSLMTVGEEIRLHVPLADQANLIAEMITRGAKPDGNRDVVFNAIMLASRYPSGPPSWTPTLDRAVRAQLRGPNEAISWNAAELLMRFPAEPGREEIITEIRSLLRTQTSDHARYGLLSELMETKWPEVRQVCKDYVKENKSDSTYTESVMEARWVTDTADAKRVSVLFADFSKPHALPQLLSYIARHKGEAGYDLSVSKAEEYAKNIEDDLAFYKKAGRVRQSRRCAHV